MNRLVKLLESPRAPLVILLLALLLTASSLWVGYFADDYQHHALLSPDMPFPKSHDGSLFGLFSFIDGDPARNLLLRDYSLLAWWSYDGFKFVFWRPVTEITHWIDHRLWHHYPVFMHVQNLLWYAALCWLVSRLFRRQSSTPLAAGAALLAFALDSSHGFGVGWISSRNAIVAATFGMVSLLTYMQWHDSFVRSASGQGATGKPGRQRKFHVISLITLALSLLSAEAGISTAAYLGAFALVLDKRGALKGVMGLIPHMLVTLAWWATYKHLGFGATNADAYYIDPAHSPLLFIAKLIERLPVMLASQFGLIPAEVYGFAGKPVPVYVTLCALYVAFVLYLMRNTLRQHATSRFWLLGSLFALLPVATALPADRNLLFVSVGGAMLVGELFQEWIKRPAAINIKQRLSSVVIAAFLSIHMIISPLLLPVMAYSPRIWTQHMQLEATRLPAIDDLEHKTLLLAGAPLPAALGMVVTRYAEELPLPARVWTLSTEQLPKTNTLTITRSSESDVTVTADGGFVNGTETALRNPERNPFHVGEKVQFSGMTLEISQLDAQGKPLSIVLHFVQPPTNDTLILQWRKDHYEVLPLPAAVGDTQTLQW